MFRYFFDSLTCLSNTVILIQGDFIMEEIQTLLGDYNRYINDIADSLVTEHCIEHCNADSSYNEKRRCKFMKEINPCPAAEDIYYTLLESMISDIADGIKPLKYSISEQVNEHTKDLNPREYYVLSDIGITDKLNELRDYVRVVSVDKCKETSEYEVCKKAVIEKATEILSFDEVLYQSEYAVFNFEYGKEWYEAYKDLITDILPNDTANTNYLSFLTQSAEKISHNIGKMIKEFYHKLYKKDDLDNKNKTPIFDYNVYKQICLKDEDYYEAVSNLIHCIINPHESSRVNIEFKEILNEETGKAKKDYSILYEYTISDKKLDKSYNLLIESQLEKAIAGNDYTRLRRNFFFDKVVYIATNQSYEKNSDLFRIIGFIYDGNRFNNFILKGANKYLIDILGSDINKDNALIRKIKKDFPKFQNDWLSFFESKEALMRFMEYVHLIFAIIYVFQNDSKKLAVNQKNVKPIFQIAQYYNIISK